MPMDAESLRAAYDRVVRAVPPDQQEKATQVLDLLLRTALYPDTAYIETAATALNYLLTDELRDLAPGADIPIGQFLVQFNFVGDDELTALLREKGLEPMNNDNLAPLSQLLKAHELEPLEKWLNSMSS